MMFKHTLGSIVRDRVSGYQGILTSRSDWYYGPTLYSVQSQEAVDGVPVESRGFDEDTLVAVEVKPDVPPDFKYKLGSKVRDAVTGYVGIIVCRTQHIHQCRRYNIQTEGLSKGLPFKGVGVDEAAVELIEAPTKPAPEVSTGSVQGAAETTESRRDHA